MKYIAFSLIMAAVLFFETALQAREQLKLLALDAPPFVSKQHGGSLEGLFYDRLKCILENMHQPYSVEIQPWKRAQAEVRAGRASGFIPASQDSIRDSYATFSGSLMEVKSYLYFLKKSEIEPDHIDFKAATIISALWGSTQYEDLKADGFTLGPVAHNFDNLFGLVERERVDVVLAPAILAETILLRRGTLKNYKKHFYSSRHSGVYITKAYLKKYPTFLKEFNKEIKSCS